MRPKSRYYKGPLSFVKSMVSQVFFRDLVKSTKNFGHITWAGNPIWQNIFDLWTIQEMIFQMRPSLILETGTNRGGSSFFYAQLFDLIGEGKVITVDVEKLHDLKHPRVTCLLGSSTGQEVFGEMQKAARAARGPVMVILDSDHSAKHFRDELELYSHLVTPGSLMLVQDGVIDTLGRFRKGRPGPLKALHDFLTTHPEFEIDRDLCTRFPITHHPDGWLRRKAMSQKAAA